MTPVRQLALTLRQDDQGDWTLAVSTGLPSRENALAHNASERPIDEVSAILLIDQIARLRDGADKRSLREFYEEATT